MHKIESNNIKSVDKSSSLIVKALDQQKRNTAMIPSTNDEIKMLNTIRTTPLDLVSVKMEAMLMKLPFMQATMRGEQIEPEE